MSRVYQAQRLLLHPDDIAKLHSGEIVSAIFRMLLLVQQMCSAAIQQHA